MTDDPCNHEHVRFEIAMDDYGKGTVAVFRCMDCGAEANLGISASGRMISIPDDPFTPPVLWRPKEKG